LLRPSSFARDLPRQRGSGVTTWNAHGDGLLELRDPINQLAAAELPRGFGTTEYGAERPCFSHPGFRGN
jgi:hypothetical protein